MAYMHLNNLYKDQDILLFKECYALEKIHGTSAHITYKAASDPNDLISMPEELIFFSGGAAYNDFVALFDKEKLLTAFRSLSLPHDKQIIVYGEAYGGKMQGMSHTYGKTLKFICFDVEIGEIFLDVPSAETLVLGLGLEFVFYRKMPTDIVMLDAERDAPSVQAVRNGVMTQRDILDGKGKPREGIVLHPLKEMRLNNGKRVMAKHRNELFNETKSPRSVEVDPAKLIKLAEANAVAEEWVTLMRLAHVLDKIPNHCMEMMPTILDVMLEDVLREGEGEIDLSKDEKGIYKAIKSATARMYQQFLNDKLHKQQESTTEGTLKAFQVIVNALPEVPIQTC